MISRLAAIWPPVGAWPPASAVRRPAARPREIKLPLQGGLIEVLKQSLASQFPPVPDDAL